MRRRRRSCRPVHPPILSGRRSAELGALIESAVDSLGDGYREVTILRQVEGLSTTETAAVLGVSEDVVKTRFSRARHALQRQLLDRTGAAAGTAFTFGQSRCDRIVIAVMARIER